MHRNPIGRLLTALALAGVLAFVAGCGGGEDASTGGASTAPDATSATPDGPTGVDRAFATLMVPHHESAIAMAKLAPARARTAFVRNLARDIVRTQRAEIDVLKQADARLAAAGVRVGTLGLPDSDTGMAGDVAMLRDAEDFDRMFIEMMIPHHESAIAMAQIELAKGGDPELRTIAQEVINAQQGEIDAMRAQLGEGEDGIDGEAPPADGGDMGNMPGM